MGADCWAVWLGAIVISALSFVPATMGHTRKARHMAGLGARLSLPVCAAATVWSTLSLLELAPPPGGVFVSAAYPFLLLQVGLAAWAVGIVATIAAERALGRSVPSLLAVCAGLASVLFMLAAK